MPHSLLHIAQNTPASSCTLNDWCLRYASNKTERGWPSAGAGAVEGAGSQALRGARGATVLRGAGLLPVLRCVDRILMAPAVAGTRCARAALILFLLISDSFSKAPVRIWILRILDVLCWTSFGVDIDVVWLTQAQSSPWSGKVRAYRGAHESCITLLQNSAFPMTAARV